MKTRHRSEADMRVGFHVLGGSLLSVVSSLCPDILNEFAGTQISIGRCSDGFEEGSRCGFNCGWNQGWSVQRPNGNLQKSSTFTNIVKKTRVEFK